jgi:hypothetical protein
MADNSRFYESAWLKWSWANAHSEMFKQYLAAWRDDPNRDRGIDLEKRYNPKRHCIVVSVAKIKALPTEWGLVLGDIVHNYRSALDCIAWALVEQGKRPPSTLTKKEQDGVYFPICDSRDWFNNTFRTKLPGVSKAEVAVVRSYQPYKTGKQLRHFHAFWVLSRLSNNDKHRAVQPVLAIAESASYKITYARDCEVTKLSGQFRAQTLEVYAELAPIYVRKTGPYPDVEMQGELRAFPAVEDVRLDDWLTKTDDNVLSLLKRLSDPPTELLAKLDANFVAAVRHA